MSKLNLKQREARDVEWEGPQGRELKRIQDSGERMKSICFPPSADRLAMLDSSRHGGTGMARLPHASRSIYCFLRPSSQDLAYHFRGLADLV